MAESDGEEVVTMVDVLKGQQEFEDGVNAVLGGSDEKDCTYSQGYIKRQAIYACMTCCPESKDDPSKRAGFCLACSLTCHENHDLIELYTKRNFRCDCGNPNFKSSCHFILNKPDLNEENVYNQNFIGLYCICNRPYGDQDFSIDDDMIQCIICEDWWHATHLDAIVPAPDQFAEMICKLCMAKNEFLHDYSDLTVKVETGDVDVVKVNGVDNTETDDKLASLTDEKIVSGTTTTTDETNGIGESSADMETSTTETNGIEGSADMETSKTETKEATPVNSENEASSIEKDGIEPKKLENKPVEAEKLQENSTESAAMDTDETDKATDVLPEVSSEGTIADKSEGVETSKEKTCETSAENAVDTASDKPAKIEETIVNAESTMSVAEDNSESPKENNESSVQAEAETTNAENVSNPSEVMDANDSNVAETGNPSVENNDTNDKITDKAKATTSRDEEIIDKSKENETTPEGSSDKDNKVDEPVNGDNTESESNSSKVPELASTENKRKIDADVTDDTSVKKAKLDVCLRPRGVKRVHKGATFWIPTFRQKLCTCNECISMYRDLSVLFLTDLEDTVCAYETLGKERTAGKPNQYEKGIEALCSLGRTQQIDALTEYNKMRDKLLTFLQSFKDKKEIVTEHDIKAFFAGMRPERRRDGVYFCR